MTFYQVSLLKDPANPGPNRLLDYIGSTLTPSLRSAKVSIYGLFQGLFGLASNELYLVTNSEVDAPEFEVADEFQLVESTGFVPTSRPTDHNRLTKEGIYVFRWFDVLLKDVDEIAALSAEAWITFEGGFDTEVQALFAEQHKTSDQGRMLLLTWYRNLAVWQESRQPPAQARANFMRRHELTLEARPIATRLI